MVCPLTVVALALTTNLYLISQYTGLSDQLF